MIKLRVDGVLHVDNYTHLDLCVFDFPVGTGFRDVKFKIFAIPEHSGLEFRGHVGLPVVFSVWPGHEVDQHGPVFMLNTADALRASVDRVRGADLEFLQRLVDALPDIVRIALKQASASPEVADLLTRAAESFARHFAIACAGRDDLPGAATAPAAEPDAGALPLPPSCVELNVPNTFLSSKFEADRNAIVSVLIGDAVRLSFPSISGWIRLLTPLPDVGRLTRGGLSLSMRLRATTKGARAAAIGIGYFDRGDYFHVVHSIARDLLLRTDPEPVDLAVAPSTFKTCLRDVETGTTIIFFVDFDAPAEIEFTPIWQFEEAAGPQDVPYRNSEDPACTALWTLNRQLARAGGRDRLGWLTKQAELAYRMDCADTAAALLTRIQPRYRELDPEGRRRFLLVFVELAFADGRIADISDMLLANYDLTGKDDALFTALSLCQPQEATGDTFDRLPSGNWNRAYLAKFPVTSKALKLLSAASSADLDRQSRLLAANQLRDTSPSLYLDALNDLLAHHLLAPLRTPGGIGTNMPHSFRPGSFRPDNFRFTAPPPRSGGPKVSVIMAVHNAAATVSHAIRSVLEQSHLRIECLVCDDCSTDGSADEIARWRGDARVRIFRSVERQGANNVRNSLIAEASGAYITVQDARHVSHPERVLLQLRALERGPAIGAIAQSLDIQPGGAIAFSRDHDCLRGDPASLMVSADTFRKYGGYRPVACRADFDLIERIRLDAGAHAVPLLQGPLTFRLASEDVSTRGTGFDDADIGFDTGALRTFAEITARRRLLGPVIMPDRAVDAVLHETGLTRAPARIVSALAEAQA